MEWHEEWDLEPGDIAAGQAEGRIAAFEVNLGASAANLMEEVAGSEGGWAGGATGAQRWVATRSLPFPRRSLWTAGNMQRILLDGRDG